MLFWPHAASDLFEPCALEPCALETNLVKGKHPLKELKGEGLVRAHTEEAWSYAQSRRRSVVQDIFVGQLQSILQCPDCGTCSHTFDGFLDLSLPLPCKSREWQAV